MSGRHGGAFGALQRKLGLRRFAFDFGASKARAAGTAKKRRRIPGFKRAWTTPTVAQMVSMVLMLGGISATALWGADYVTPSKCIWTGSHDCAPTSDVSPSASASSASSVTFMRRRGLRDPVFRRKHLHPTQRNASEPLSGQSYPTPILQKRAPQTLANLDGWSAADDPRLVISENEIVRNIWTSSDRLGLIAFALTPLVVTLALKLWPFAAFSVRECSSLC